MACVQSRVTEHLPLTLPLPPMQTLAFPHAVHPTQAHSKWVLREMPAATGGQAGPAPGDQHKVLPTTTLTQSVGLCGPVSLAELWVAW